MRRHLREPRADLAAERERLRALLRASELDASYLQWLADRGSQAAVAALEDAYRAPLEGRERRRALLGGDYWELGWYVEIDDELAATLTRPRFAEMFWTAYDVEIHTRDPAQIAVLEDANAWCLLALAERIVLRSRAFPDLCAEQGCFPGGGGVIDGEIQMRGLFLSDEDLGVGRVRRLWRSILGLGS